MIQERQEVEFSVDNIDSNVKYHLSLSDVKFLYYGKNYVDFRNQ